MLQFPTEFPMDALKILGQYAIKKNVPLVQAATAAWNVLGYGGFMALGESPVTWGEDTPDEAAQETFFSSLELVKDGNMKAIPAWVYQLAFNIILNFIKRKVS